MGTSAGPRRSRIARLVSALVAAAGWDQTRDLLERYPELSGRAARERLAELAGRADRAGDAEAAATYRFHQELVLRSRAAGPEAAVTSIRADADLVPRLVADGTAAYRCFAAAGRAGDLASAVDCFERAASLAGAWHPDRPAVLNDLGLALFERATADDQPAGAQPADGLASDGQPPGAQRQADLDRAVAALEESAAAAGADPAARSAALANLGTALLTRCSAADPERAAAVLEEAARLTADDTGERAKRLANLGIALSESHLRTGRPDLLERALAAYAEAVALTAADSADRPSRLANLGTGLAERYTLRGDPGDLDRAIDVMARAADQTVPATPGARAERADWLDNLGLLLRDRYLRDGDLADLDGAESRLAAALALTPAGAARPGRLDQHATTLRMQALSRGDPGRLRRALDVHRQAAALPAGSAEERGRILSNLGGTLRAWARQAGDLAALAEAVAAYREALAVVRVTERAAVLTNLGSALLDQYDQAGRPADLDAAVGLLSESVEATGPDSPELPGRLSNLGNGLRRRYERDGRSADAERAAGAYRQGLRRGIEAAPGTALRSALNWGGWSVRRQAWDQAHEAYDGAREAAGRLLGQHLARRDQQAWLSEVGDLPAQAAYARCQTGEPDAAAEWLEWGRARALADALGRARLDSLEPGHPQLARRYRQAAARLNAPRPADRTAG